ncbi:MAG: D-alanine--D-alanine ligase [Betaproteobacteria bacterium]|nr:D-alanine--D-alanine ligase [Betaproteobacteria bacterium]
MNQKKQLKINVLFGGDSAERDVSVASGAQVVKALRQRSHTVNAIDTTVGLLNTEQERQLFDRSVASSPPVTKKGLASVLSWLNNPTILEADLWFIALHGGSGEDGRWQGLLAMTGIPFTGSSVLGSALAMDKDMTKRILRQAGLPTPNWLMAPAKIEDIEQQLGWPVVIKPSKQGSTVGLSIVRQADELDAAQALAFQHDDEVMIEQFIPGRELTCPVLHDKALPVGEIILKRGEIFDYEAKYQPGGAEEVFPALLDDLTTRHVQDLSLQIHQTLKLTGYSRSDFRLDNQGRLWCLEVNTLPGLTAMSLLPQSAQVAGITFPELIEQICFSALRG